MSATLSVPAAAAVLLDESFDIDTNTLSGKAGFAGKYCADGWTTALNGGVIAKTDNGCSCVGRGQSACDYAVYTAAGKSCYKSEPVDNVLVTGDTTWTDYTVSVKLRNLDDDTLGLVFRYVNTANYYAVWLSRDVGPGVGAPCDGSFPGARLVKISAKTGAGKAELIAASQLTYEVGKVHLLRVRVQGPSIVVHFDANADGVIDEKNELLFNAFDPSHTHGAVGLFAYQNGAAPGTKCAAGGCWFDDLHVESIVPAVIDDAGGTSADGGGSALPDAGSSLDGVVDSAGLSDVGVSVDAVDGAGRPAADVTTPPDMVATDTSVTDSSVTDGSVTDGVVAYEGDPSQPLTLTVVGSADDAGCSTGSGTPAPLAAMLLLSLLMLRRRRSNRHSPTSF